MKRWPLVGTSVLGLAVWSWVMAAPALSQGRGQGFRPCPYAPYTCKVSNLCRPLNDRGKVVQVRTEMIQEGMYPGMALLVDTKSHGQVLVHLGPVWYLERQEFTINPGDEVGIKGMCDKLDGKVSVVAYELTKGDYVLHLRDAQGRPNWEAWRQR
ncbi:MAG: hypothetical protein AB1424_18835 [Thermodesulfobacteriota bacterium]